MKKALAIILSLALVATSGILLAACGKQEQNNENPEVIEGGWEMAESPEITDEVRELLKKAYGDMAGVSYTAVAYLGKQIVAGTNHCILCKVAPVVPEPSYEYKLVYIYEDLDGNAEITQTVDTKVGANYSEDLMGGWAEAQSPEMTEDATKAFETATETLTGAEYKPAALLATQVVAGINYRILCQAKATVPNAEPYYVIITVYADLDGNAEITDTVEINV